MLKGCRRMQKVKAVERRDRASRKSPDTGGRGPAEGRREMPRPPRSVRHSEGVHKGECCSPGVVSYNRVPWLLTVPTLPYRLTQAS